MSGDAKAQVMQRVAALGEKLRDRRISRHRLDQFERDAAGIDESQTMRADDFRLVGRRSTSALNSAANGRRIRHGDADVIERHAGDRRPARSRAP